MRLSGTRAAHATAVRRQNWAVHIPGFIEKLKRPEKSSTTDVTSTSTWTQREDGMSLFKKLHTPNGDLEQTHRHPDRFTCCL